jgi:hypothetical protein
MDTSYVPLISPGYPIKDRFLYGSSKLKCIDNQEQAHALIHVLFYYLILLSRAWKISLISLVHSVRARRIQTLQNQNWSNLLDNDKLFCSPRRQSCSRRLRGTSQRGCSVRRPYCRCLRAHDRGGAVRKIGWEWRDLAKSGNKPRLDEILIGYSNGYGKAWLGSCWLTIWLKSLSYIEGRPYVQKGSV